MKDRIQFFKTALDDYRVGAVVPSSKYVVQKVLLSLPPDIRYIVEYGAGDGVITKGLLSRLPSDGRLVAVERNPLLAARLREISDDRLVIVEDDVVALSNDFSQFCLPRIDAVISGIPFTFFNPATRRQIVANTHRALAPGGLFLAYQVSPLMVPYLKNAFENRVGIDLELRNLPPYFILKGWKRFNPSKN